MQTGSTREPDLTKNSGALSLIPWRSVFILLILPLVIMAVLIVVSFLQGRLRYDPELFSGMMLDRYGVPGAVAVDLQTAFNEGDGELMRSLQGTRRITVNFEARPRLIFAVLYSLDGGYFNYLYVDSRTFERVIQHVKEIDGRYVVVPENLYYYIDSGRWQAIFGPLLLTWWTVVVVATGAFWIYRITAITRRELFD